MHVLVTYKNEEDHIKNEVGVATTFLLLSVFGDYSRRSSAANSTIPSESWAKFKLLQDLRIVLITCKTEEYLTRNESARVVTTVNTDFQTLKGSLLHSRR